MLRRNLGNVGVSGGGSASVMRTPDWSRGGRLRTHVTGGEYYIVNCPFCRDTRQRLWINALWGTRDQATGQELWHLAVCYNENCLASESCRIELREIVHAFPAQSCRRVTTKVVERSGTSPAITLPAGRVPVNSPECPAHVQYYLEARAFDLDELATRWQVSYVRHSTDARPQLHDRILIPVLRPAVCGDMRPLLAGWQARTVGDNGAGKKYLNSTGMMKSALLYGLPGAMKSRCPAVIVEGVTDVWRLGPGAVALFGKSASKSQVSLIATHFANRQICIMLDADAADEALELRVKLDQAVRDFGRRNQVRIVKLSPGDGDVADCTRAEAWSIIKNQVGKT